MSISEGESSLLIAMESTIKQYSLCWIKGPVNLIIVIFPQEKI
jgi:hypothetical protein